MADPCGGALRPAADLPTRNSIPELWKTTLFVSKEDFKFNAAHFVVHATGRERLHGHNYKVSLMIDSHEALGGDGFLVDFSHLKRIMRTLCKGLDERFLCPIHSPHMTTSRGEGDRSGNIELRVAHDGSFFSFPAGDCVELPVVAITVEVLARYLLCEFVEAAGRDESAVSGGWAKVDTLTVCVMETPGQEARVTKRLR